MWLGLCVALAACGRGLPPQATAIDAEWAHVELADLSRGRALVITKCGSSCHRTPLPAQHTPREWPAVVDDMAEQAHLAARDKQLVEQYLITMSRATTGPLGPAPASRLPAERGPHEP